MINPSAFVRAVSMSTGVSVGHLVGPLRHPVYSRPRSVAALAMRWAGLSLYAIGRELGGRDHSTVTAAAKRAGADLGLLAAAADLAVRCELERGLPL